MEKRMNGQAPSINLANSVISASQATLTPDNTQRTKRDSEQYFMEHGRSYEIPKNRFSASRLASWYLK